MIENQHIERRLKFAFSNFLQANLWRKIVFADEKKFSLDESDGIRNYRHDLRQDPTHFFKACGRGRICHDLGRFLCSQYHIHYR